MNIQENKRYFHFQQYCLSLRTGKIPRMKKQFLENFVFVEICGKKGFMQESHELGCIYCRSWVRH